MSSLLRTRVNLIASTVCKGEMPYLCGSMLPYEGRLVDWYGLAIARIWQENCRAPLRRTSFCPAKVTGKEAYFTVTVSSLGLPTLARALDLFPVAKLGLCPKQGCEEAHQTAVKVAIQLESIAASVARIADYCWHYCDCTAEVGVIMKHLGMQSLQPSLCQWRLPWAPRFSRTGAWRSLPGTPWQSVACKSSSQRSTQSLSPFPIVSCPSNFFKARRNSMKPLERHWAANSQCRGDVMEAAVISCSMLKKNKDWSWESADWRNECACCDLPSPHLLDPG